MMRSYKRFLIYLLLLAAVLSGCEAQPASKAALPAETAATAEVTAIATTVATPTATATAVPTAEASADPTADQVALPQIDVDIPEKMFVTQMNDIIIRSEDYLGKVIRYEGMFAQYNYTVYEVPTSVSMVFRYGPGCCGYDGIAGLEVGWDGALPQNNDWVEAVGVLESYEESGAEYLRLALTSLKVLEVRGAETVTQ